MQLALPCAVSKTGIFVGGLLFGLVAALTFASCSIIVRYVAFSTMLAQPWLMLARDHHRATHRTLAQPQFPKWSAFTPLPFRRWSLSPWPTSAAAMPRAPRKCPTPQLLTTRPLARRYAGRAGVNSYGELVQTHFGRLGSTLLQSAIVVHVSGVMIGYNGEGLGCAWPADVGSRAPFAAAQRRRR